MPPKKTASTTKEKTVAKKGKTLKEKQISEETAEEIPQKTKKAATKKADTINTDDVKITKNKKTAKADPPPENENGPAKKRVRNAKKAEPEEVEQPKEVAGTSKAAKGKRGKKNTEEQIEEKQEAPPDSPKASRKRAPKRKSPKAETEAEVEAEPVKEKKTKAAPAPRSNATVTNWDSIDFKCNSGKPPNFHIISWNVDGIRAWIKKGGLELLTYDQPDILCIQETKCSKDKIPEEINQIEGYVAYWCSSDKEGYAGVGVLTKTEPLEVMYGINSKEHDNEGRSITLEYEKFYLVNVYVPNAGRKLVTLPKRLEWNKAFKTFIKNLDKNKPVIICGDMNVAHKEIDLANPKTNTKNAGFTIEEREGMTDFLESGFVDTFRELYPDKEKAYTFWTYMANARVKNVGWRLDYFIVSERFKDSVCDNVILKDILGSDHCPVLLHINV